MTTILINRSSQTAKSFLGVVLVIWLLGLPAYAADNGDFTVLYDGSSSPRHHEYISLLQGQQFFEAIASDLNGTLALPRDIKIVLGECNEVNAWWSPTRGEIVICYELIDSLYDTFIWIENSSQERLGSLVLGNLKFTFYHELAHALIDLYDISFPMREEDNADQLATIVLIQEGDVSAALSAVFAFLAARGDTPYWDEHSLDEQRAYHIQCLIYGSDPEAYAWLVSEGHLPIERASYCPEEYEQIMEGWAIMLEQYVVFIEENAPYSEASNEPSAQQGYKVEFRFTSGEATAVMVIRGNQALMRTTFFNSTTGQQEQVDQKMTRQPMPNGTGDEFRGTTPTYADTDIPHPSYQPDIVYFYFSSNNTIQIELVDAVDGRRFSTEITKFETLD